MSTKAKALLTLFVAAPILTELVSSSTPAHGFLNPGVAFLLILVYGVPLLVIREISLRWRLSTIGVFLLGLAYGVLNEGLIAQTLIRYEHVPIDRFDHYICLGGFNISWVCLILPWHAFLAILFPIALLHHWFPAISREAWLGRTAFRVCATFLVASMVVLAAVRHPRPQMMICLAAIAVFVLLGLQFQNASAAISSSSSRRLRPFVFGSFAYVIPFLSLIFLAAVRAPAFAYFAVVAALFSVFLFLRDRFDPFARTSAWVALGAYFAASLFSAFGGLIRHSVEIAATGFVLSFLFIFLAVRRISAHSQAAGYTEHSALPPGVPLC